MESIQKVDLAFLYGELLNLFHLFFYLKKVKCQYQLLTTEAMVQPPKNIVKLYKKILEEEREELFLNNRPVR